MIKSREFITSEQGQDVVEYTLLLAFVVLVGAATYLGMGTVTSGIWTIANNRIAAANN